MSENVRRILAWLREAKKAKADLVAFPELAVTGYPPEDLLLKTQFVDDNRRALNHMAAQCRGLVAIVSYVGQGAMSEARRESYAVVSAVQHHLYNAAAVIADRRVVAAYCKWFLPNYGVFDENRFFQPGRSLPPLRKY